MLRITMNKSAEGAKKYYSEEYYSEGVSHEAEYYSEKGQVIGRWGGMGAEKLGLVGDVTKNDFGDMCDNINPQTGKTLTGRNDVGRTVGYDFTFNACKSVSVAYTFGSDEDKREILSAFRESVRETMNEIEKGMQARVRRGGKNENRETGNIAYGEFIHFTTRPVDGVPDPHLHSHCFIFNATFDGQDKKWKAGQFRQLKQDAPYYEACFHSSFAARMEDLGYRVKRTKDGFELKGLDKSTCDKFSRRTKEIEEHAKEHNIIDNKQKDKIGAKTRENKRVDVNPNENQKNWESRLTPEETEQIKRLKKLNDTNNDNNNTAIAKDALTYSLNHHLERKSVASDKEILATAIKSSVGKATPEQIRKEFADNKNILSKKEQLRTFITTKDALAEEKQLIINANSFKGKFKSINENYEFKNNELNKEQKRAIQYALTTNDGITIIAGRAGTGKTTLMKEVRFGIQEAGKRIFSFAPSSEASRVVQRNEGFSQADTVASLINNKSLHPDMKNQVIWVDEAGMLSNKDLNKILAIAKEQNARLILSGDTKQHSSVERGDALRVIQKYAGITPITVSKIQRQKNELYRLAVKFLSESSVEKGFEKLDKIGAIHEVADSGARIKAVAEDYYNSAFKDKKPVKEVLVIAPTHVEGDLATKKIRAKLKEENIISNDERQFKVLKNLQYTEAEKQRTENYHAGDILSFHQHMKGIKSGSKLEIIGAKENEILARDSEGKEYTVPLAKAKHFNVFQEKTVQIAKNDKIRITGGGKTLEGVHLFNGISYQVAGFDRQGNIRLSNGSTLSKDYGHFTFGYVMTSHASQGKTADKIIISQSSMSFRAASQQQFYVSVSRGRQAVSIYTDDKTELLNAVKQSTERKSATELLNAVEINRLQNIKNKAVETYNKLKKTMVKNELPPTIRKVSQGKAR